MTELLSISENPGSAETHVVFVPGLSGNIKRTWTSEASGSSVLWPRWLEEDVPGTAVWLLGYPAAKTNWGGYGLSTSDRASSILARLLSESDLSQGDIVFVAHSLGGLIVEQVLRKADSEARSDRRAENFLTRVRKVAFLGTPHKGSHLATLAAKLGPLVRMSDATQDLVVGSPQMKDLNGWYRQFSRDKGIRHLLLVESKPETVCGIRLLSFLGRIVSEASADGGFQEMPIPVDESHSGICKPSNREAEVYVHVRDFISREIDGGRNVTPNNEVLEEHTRELRSLRESTDRQSAAFAELMGTINSGSAAQGARSRIIDAEASGRLDRLRKCRTFGEFGAIEEARALAASLENGELAQASEDLKGTALSWCARILSSVEPDEAAVIVARANGARDESYCVAQCLVKAALGALHESIEALIKIGTPMAFGAAYISILRAEDSAKANEWLRKAGLSFSDLDGDGKFFFLRRNLEEEHWDMAYEAANEVADEDYEHTPGLYFATADAFLMQAVPTELRTFLLQQNLPFEAAGFPLRGDPSALKNRRRASELYGRLHSVAETFGLSGVAGLMDDKALWLRLVDPEGGEEAREELENSLRDQQRALRRLGLGLQFGVEIDLEWAEREVDRQSELSDGMSPDAASSRFALALSKGSPADVANYIDVHRRQLLKHLAWKGVYFVELEMLAKSGQLAKAEELLKEAVEKGLSERETVQLRRMLSEASGGDPITERLAAYKEEDSILNLRMLVAAYQESEDWSRACEYGRKLVDTTRNLADARRLVIALYNCGSLEDALVIMEEFPGLLVEDESLQVLRAQIQFESGWLSEASQSLQTLREYCDSSEVRQLQINVAVASGDWESLQGFVEDEWKARNDRSALDLLRAGQIAEHIGVARGEELVREAASRADDDPAILAGCFHVASAAGWEGSEEVHRWMERAAELSEPGGPIQAISLKEVLDRKPDWERRESKAWNLLETGEAPAFVAGNLLNRSLLSLNLMPALLNLNEEDVRKRALIYAFSGARERVKVAPSVVAMDATALISTEFLGLLDVCIEEFSTIVIPHGTLAWLLEEKARILFHQPSQVVAARELRSMITEGHLRVFEGSKVAPERLVNEVGIPLATIFAEVSLTEHPDERQRLVVRGGPIHKADSLMQEEADLTEFEACLCSGFSVIDLLTKRGLLTELQARNARTSLNAHEVPWPSEPQIGDDAVLYLDDLAVPHLQRLGLLSKLRQAGVTTFVSGSEIEEADALISYDERATEVVEIVEQLRHRLREGIMNGKVRLGQANRGDGGNGTDQMTPHPTVDMLRLVADADVGVVDDRFVNRHGRMSLETTIRPLLTTVDLLDVLLERGSISEELKRNALTRLRQANFALVPLTADELQSYLVNSTVRNETLEETAELKAIRECIQRVQMSNMLQWPQERVWLNGVTQACLVCLQEQWMEGLDEATAAARSDWLLGLGDVRAWAHRVDESVEELMERHRNWLLDLMTLPARQQQSMKKAYWRWLDLRVLEPLQDEDRETYEFLVERAKEHVAGMVEACEKVLEDNNDQ